MARTWVFKETGEVRQIRTGEYYLDSHQQIRCWLPFLSSNEKYIGLSLTVYDPDPMEELKEQIELLTEFIPDGWEMPLGWNQVVAQAKETIKKAVEGK
jgi:hypothetical protein